MLGSLHGGHPRGIREPRRSQNGVVRVVGNLRYPSTRPATDRARHVPTREPWHARAPHFIPDSVSLLDGSVYTERLLASSQVTDTYLLHLAASNDALLATFDTRIVTTAVPSGAEVVFAIP